MVRSKLMIVSLNISDGVFTESLRASNTQAEVSGGTFDFASFFGGSATVSGGQFRVLRASNDFTMTAGTAGDSGSFGNGTGRLLGGTIGDRFRIGRATFDMSGGRIGSFLELELSTLNFSDGQIGNDFEVTLDSVANISGGTVGNRFVVFGEGTANITGGQIGNNFSVGELPSTYQNRIGGTAIISGGQIGNNFNAGNGSVVNISGGTFGSSFDALQGSQVTISDGEFGNRFTANRFSAVDINGGQFGENFVASSGSNVDISGGQFGKNFAADFSVINSPFASTVAISGGNFGIGFAALGTDVQLQGGEFKLNGLDISSRTTVSIFGDDVLTGALADGSSFIFSNNSGDNISNVTLSNVALPTSDTTPIVVDTKTPDLPSGLRIGQSLTVQEGGVLQNNFEAVDAVVNIQAGSIGDGFGTSRSTVNLDGGTIGDDFKGHAGSIINVNGGSIGDEFEAFTGSIVNINEGSIGDNFNAGAGSEVFLSGGSIGQGFDVSPDSLVRINGGTVGRGFGVFSNSDVELSGGEFQLNGETFTNSTISLAAGDVFTGTLEDGSAFIFSHDASDRLFDVNLNQTALPDADTTPIFVNSSMPNAPSGLRSGQTLTLEQGGSIDGEFEAVGGVVNVNGGGFESDTAFFDTMVTITEGQIDGVTRAHLGTELNILGGTVSSFIADVGSEINIHGGDIENQSFVNAGSSLDIFATEFFINNVAVEFTDFDEPLLLANRNMLLSGVFSDGSEFSYSVGSFPVDDFFVSPDATFRLNLVPSVPEPSSAFLLALSGLLLFGKRRRCR